MCVLTLGEGLTKNNTTGYRISVETVNIRTNTKHVTLHV